MGRFKLKWGDREVEYEGEDSEIKYEAALKLLQLPKQSKPALPRNVADMPKSEGAKPSGGKKPIFVPQIEKLIDEEYFKLPHKKSVRDVTRMLEDRGLPVKGKRTQIQTALKRQLRKRLKGTKTDGEWVFWQE